MTYRRPYADHPRWLSRFAVFLLLLVTAAAFGCGIVLYKAGSTDSAYEAARDRCHNEGRAAGADFDRCMEEQGWTVKQLGSPAPPSNAKKSVPAESSPTRSPSPPPSADVAPSAQHSDAPAGQQPIVVKNWFKLGGTAEELAAAKKRCATKLGVADRPEPASDAVTGEMLDCLRNEGWRAF